MHTVIWKNLYSDKFSYDNYEGIFNF